MSVVSACGNRTSSPIIHPSPTQIKAGDISLNEITVIPILSISQTPLTPTFEATPFTEITPISAMIDWKESPIIPAEISWRSREIYKLGQEMKNNPNAFSVVGDCESSPSWFLGDFDRGSSYYKLEPYDNLKSVIDYFQGSFERKNLAVGNGFNTASVLSPFWADPEYCLSGESPLDCEVRIHHPSFAFILLGTNDIYNVDIFESNMRKILDRLMEKGVLPILATKADNLDGGNQINAIISSLAYEYEIPLWNFWRAVQDLPSKGLQPDGAHLTWARNYFDDSKAMENAWPWRNLTALQVLDKVLSELK